MSVWSILEFVGECCNLLEHWRFFVCVFVGAVVAFGAYTLIGIDPWRWAAAISIMLTSVWIGGRWEHR